MGTEDNHLREVYQEMADLGLENPKGGKTWQQKADSFIKKAEVKKEEGRFWQIDFLKVFAMLLVIMDHSTTHAELHAIGSPFWERIAIPIFMIVLGFNWAKSLQKKKGLSYRKLFSWKNYWQNKIVRFLFPYSIIYGLSILMFFFIDTPQNIAYYNNPLLRYILFMFVWGPGNWFIPTLLLTVLVFPLVFMIFDKIPIVGLILSFGVEVGWQFLINKSIDAYLASSSPTYNGYILLYFSLICTPFVLMSAIGMGIWLSQNHRLFSPRNIIIWLLAIFSVFYIYLYTFPPALFLLSKTWSLKLVNFMYVLRVWSNGDYNMFFFPWSALIVMICLNILPRNPKGIFARFITLVSKSTYHILMVQIFTFSILYNLYLPLFETYPGQPLIWASVYPGIKWINLMFYPLHVVWTFGWGILWYWLEKKVLWDNIEQISAKMNQLSKSLFKGRKGRRKNRNTI
jgi:hypothetical protein